MKYILLSIFLFCSSVFAQLETFKTVRVRETGGFDWVALIAPALAASYTITLPSTIGLANECLKNSATPGALTFGTCGSALASPLTTKGDIWVYSTVDTRQPVGTNGFCLKANSAQTTGLEWASCSGAGITIGDAVNSGTATAVLYVGTGPVLAQDAANFNYESALKQLRIDDTVDRSVNAAKFQISTANATGGGIALNNYSGTSGFQPVFEINKSGSNTKGTQALISSGESLGSFVFRGSDGTNFEPAAAISATVDSGASPGNNDMPGRLSFTTTADGSNTLTERMFIDRNGQIFFNSINVLTNCGGTTPTFCSGSYTATTTCIAAANCDGTTSFTAMVFRVGNQTCVHGKSNIDPTTSGNTTRVTIAIPITSGLSATDDAFGQGQSFETVPRRNNIFYGGTSNTVELDMIPSYTSSETVTWEFCYYNK